MLAREKKGKGMETRDTRAW